MIDNITKRLAKVNEIQVYEHEFKMILNVTFTVKKH